MIIYGRNPVAEALRGRRAHTIAELWATAGAQREPWLTRARAAGVHVHAVSTREIERLCGSSAHQGVCASAGPYPYASAERLLHAPGAMLVALDQVQDPQNLGSICRTAECAGAGGVVIPERRAAAVTPAVCKASAGAVEHLAVAQVKNLADFLLQARKAGLWCYGATPSARADQPAPVAYELLDYGGSAPVLVLGGEARGLRPRVASACDQLVCLPMRGHTPSLGVSAAAAALLYGILHARGAGVDKGP